MKTWNYRVLEVVHPSGEVEHAIHEVYYENGKPTSYTENPVRVVWYAEEGMAAATAKLEAMKLALEKPVLKTTDFIQKNA